MPEIHLREGDRTTAYAAAEDATTLTAQLGVPCVVVVRIEHNIPIFTAMLRASFDELARRGGATDLALYATVTQCGVLAVARFLLLPTPEVSRVS